MTKQKLAVTVGDPTGIGPEITVLAFQKIGVLESYDLVAVGDARAIERGALAAKVAMPIHLLQTWDSPIESGAINVMDVPGAWDQLPEWGKVSPEAGKASIDAVEVATLAALAGDVGAIVTGPINKEAIWASGCEHLGHTELLGALTGVDTQDTMFVVRETHKPGRHLRVFFATRHVSLKKAVEQVTHERILSALHRTHLALVTLGVDEPVIAVAALNPHGGEGGAFGAEEQEVLAPAIADAQASGINAIGPIPADSIFHQGLEGRFDGVLALYHDQGHISTKTFDFHGTISLTIGLPILRTSVDHGTAFDIAGKGVANPGTMESAIYAALDYVDAVPKLKEAYSPRVLEE